MKKNSISMTIIAVFLVSAVVLGLSQLQISQAQTTNNTSDISQYLVPAWNLPIQPDFRLVGTLGRMPQNGSESISIYRSYNINPLYKTDNYYQFYIANASPAGESRLLTDTKEDIFNGNNTNYRIYFANDEAKNYFINQLTTKNPVWGTRDFEKDLLLNWQNGAGGMLQVAVEGKLVYTRNYAIGKTAKVVPTIFVDKTGFGKINITPESDDNFNNISASFFKGE